MDKSSWTVPVVAGMSIALASCTQTVQAPSAGLERLQAGTTRAGAGSPEPGGSSGLAQLPGTACDLKSEMAVSEGCLKAWRTALAGDTAGAMRQLAALEKEYPKQSTAHFMMGQVMEHAGNKEAAVKYYSEAQADNRFSALYLFKLAEALRRSGKNTDAVARYRRLLQQAPQFAPGRLGLASALYALDKSSSEARREVEAVLSAEPGNKEALALKARMAGSR